MSLVFEHLKSEGFNVLKDNVGAFYITPQKAIQLLIGGELISRTISPAQNTAAALATELKDLDISTFILIAPQHYVLEDHKAENLINDILFLDEVCYILQTTHKKTVFVHTSIFFAYFRMNRDLLLKQTFYEMLTELLNSHQISRKDKSKITWFKFFTQKKIAHDPISALNQPKNFVYDAPIMNSNDIFSTCHLTPCTKFQKIAYYFNETEIINCHYPVLNVETSYPAYKLTEALHFYSGLVKWRDVKKFDFFCYIGDIYIGDSVFGFIDNENQKFGNVEPIRNGFKLPLNLNEISIRNILGEAHIGHAAFFVEENVPKAEPWLELDTLHLNDVHFIGSRAFESRVLYGSNTAWCNVKTLLMPNVKLILNSFRSFAKNNNNAWQNLTCLTLNGGMSITSECYQEAFKSQGDLENTAFQSVDSIRFIGTNEGELSRDIMNRAFENASWQGKTGESPWDAVDFTDFSCAHLLFDECQWTLQELQTVDIIFPPTLVTRVNGLIELNGMLKNHKPPTRVSLLSYSDNKVVFCKDLIANNSMIVLTEDPKGNSVLNFAVDMVDSDCNYGKVTDLQAFLDLEPPVINCFSLQINSPQPIIFGFLEEGEEESLSDIRIQVTGEGFSETFALTEGTVDLSNSVYSVDFAKNGMQLSTGTYTATVRATDRVFNTAECEATILIDPNLPDFDFEAVPFPFNQASVILRGCIEVGATLEIQIDDGDRETVDTDNDNCFVFITDPLIEGKHVATFFITKNGITTTFPYFLLIDLTAQGIEVTSVVPGSTINKSEITLEGVVDDPLSIVTVNGKEAVVNIDGTFSVDLLLQEGVNLIEIFAVDSNGIVLSYTFRLTVDTQPPIVPMITQVVDGNNNKVSNEGFTNSDSITLTGITDPKTTVTLLNGNVQIAQTISNATGKWVIELNSLIAGVYKLKLIAVDKAKNMSQTDVFFNFTIILTPPVAPTVTSVDGSTNFVVINQTPLIQGKFDSAQTHILTVEIIGNTSVTYTSNDLVMLDTVQGMWELLIPMNQQLAFGGYTLRLTAQDQAGNISTFERGFSVCEFGFTINPITNVNIIELDLTFNCAPNSVTFLDENICAPLANALGGIDGTKYTLILPGECLGILPLNSGGFPMIRLTAHYGNSEKTISEIQVS
ncbi:MAG: hypothetical protein H6850_03710 [Alphaproteobacteria bacterium]|nr:MAG: hypothetical protein H6850_03710 [Alphaproteobacteria bacterium]